MSRRNTTRIDGGMPRTPQELEDFIKGYISDNIKIDVEKESDYSYKYISVTVRLGDEIISSDSCGI